jgi:hypothetical protein
MEYGSEHRHSLSGRESCQRHCPTPVGAKAQRVAVGEDTAAAERSALVPTIRARDGMEAYGFLHYISPESSVEGCGFHKGEALMK